MARIELATSPLPRECSATELHGRGFCGPGSRRLRGVYGVFGEGAEEGWLDAGRPAGGVLTGAGEGNRTLVFSLEGYCSTIELHPRGQACSAGPACEAGCARRAPGGCGAGRGDRDACCSAMAARKLRRRDVGGGVRGAADPTASGTHRMPSDRAFHPRPRLRDRPLASGCRLQVPRPGTPGGVRPPGTTGYCPCCMYCRVLLAPPVPPARPARPVAR